MSIIKAGKTTRLSIGSPLSSRHGDLRASDFASQSWTTIQSFDGLVPPTNAADGCMGVVITPDDGDAGQVQLKAAEQSHVEHAFKIEVEETRSPTQRLFIAKVERLSEIFDEVKHTLKLNASLAVNSNVVRIDAL